MCVWFLYNILGWSAFVGMVVMIALFPIPGTVAGKIQKVQRESVKRVSILPYQYLDVWAYFVVRRTRVCRPLPKVRPQTQVCVARALTSLVYSHGNFTHDQAIWLGA
jgi:hypothetical protein